MILIYAFSNHWATNVSRLTAAALAKEVRPNNKGIDFKIINGYPQEFFRKYIENNYYSLIIGLGDGSRYIDKIQIETKAKNSYNERSIYPYSPIYLELSLPPIDDYDHQYFGVSSNMGTYNCNYLAYRTQLYLDQKKLDTKHIFLHLPPKFDAATSSKAINDFFTLNHLI
jgi:hypothetical protein